MTPKFEAIMNFPERFSNLPEYAFPRLRGLLDVHTAGGDALHLTIGEPQHDFPDWVLDIIVKNGHEFRKYPPTTGSPELLSTISKWLKQRYGVDVDPASEILNVTAPARGCIMPQWRCALKPRTAKSWPC